MLKERKKMRIISTILFIKMKKRIETHQKESDGIVNLPYQVGPLALPSIIHQHAA